MTNFMGEEGDGRSFRIYRCTVYERLEEVEKVKGSGWERKCKNANLPERLTNRMEK